MKTYKICGLLTALSVAALGCEVEDPGRLPDVDTTVTPGEMPEVDTDLPDVDVEPKTTTVPVPDVDVDTKDTEITVPNIEVNDEPDGDDAAVTEKPVDATTPATDEN